MVTKEDLKGKLIVKDNRLIHSNLLSTPTGNRMLIKVLASIEKEDKDFGFVDLSISEEIKDTNSKNVDDLVKNFASWTFRIEDKGKTIWYSVYDRFEWIKGTDILRVRLHEDMKTFLLQLTGNYTKAPAIESYEMTKTPASYKLYELLKSKSFGHSNGKFKVSIADLRDFMKVNEGQYTRFDNFEKRIIKPAVKENQKIFDKLEYTKLKAGRSINAVQFTWTPQGQKDKPIEEIKDDMSFSPMLSLFTVNMERKKHQREEIGRRVFEDRLKRLQRDGFTDRDSFELLILGNHVTDRIRECCPAPANIKNKVGYVKDYVKSRCDLEYIKKKKGG